MFSIHFLTSKYGICWLFVFISISSVAQGQDSIQTKQKEIRLVIENDVFTSFYRDQYYTSGIFLHYRWLAANQIAKRKMIRSASFHQSIYTPELVSWDDPSKFDRPYAGVLAAYFSQEYYMDSGHYLKVTVEMGIIGPRTHTDDFQIKWHTFLNIPVPAGWKYQIGNAPIINLHGIYARQLAHGTYSDLISETRISLGTTFNSASEDLVLRLGRLDNFKSSTHYNGRLGLKWQEVADKKPIETYLFLAIGLQYQVYNATIEGNLIGTDSPHTEIAKDWMVQKRIGLTLSWSTFDLVTVYHFSSPETTKAKAHQYVSVNINKRF